MTNAVAVLGSGSWGTALAVHLAQVGHEVRLWARDPQLAADMSRERVNAAYLPGIALPANLQPTSAVADAVDGAGFLVVAVPSHGLRVVARAAQPFVRDDAILVSAAKGLEAGSLLRMTAVIREEVPGATDVVALSGPSFAAEFARGLPTALVAAAGSSVAVELVQGEFRSGSVRLYGSGDVVGVEIGGALKNIIAIAAGVVEGLGLGHNALAALITRGLAEVTRLAVALGAQRETLSGLAGLGDLVLTCTGDLSRNRRVGIELARGRSLDDILSHTRMVAEGVKTTHAALELAARCGVELPIATQMADVFAGRKDPQAAIRELMGRRQKLEHV